ncbi:MAG: hypothetical protein AAFV80_18745, partial [Bacteroidota bacterium]
SHLCTLAVSKKSTMNLKGLDHFESIFKRAIRHRFEFKAIRLSKMLLLIDSDQDQDLKDELKQQIFNTLETDFVLESLVVQDFSDWQALESAILTRKPDLIIAERLLKENDKSFQHSLGVYLEAITQRINIPLLVLPVDQAFQLRPEGEILVGTGHQYVDDSLIHFAAYFAQGSAKLRIVHVEDIDTFNYYLDAIERIPELHSSIVRETLMEELKNRPIHYFEQVKRALGEANHPTEVEIFSEAGRVIEVYRELITHHPVDLIIFEADDDSQLAMHSVGYSIAIEFQNIPVLLV